MLPTKPLQDPLGNEITITCRLIESFRGDYSTIESLIRRPVFVIAVKNHSLYYIKRISFELNLLVEARALGEGYHATSVRENPSVDFISRILTKGRLISFR